MGQLQRSKDLPPVPIRLVLTNVPVIAMIFAQIGHDFGFYIMVTDLPKYMKDVLHFSVADNGLYSSLPYLVMWIVSIATGVLGDWLIKHQHLSITMSRKVFTTIGRCKSWSWCKVTSKNFVFFSFCVPLNPYPARILCWLRSSHRRRTVHPSNGLYGNILPWHEAQPNRS